MSERPITESFWYIRNKSLKLSCGDSWTEKLCRIDLELPSCLFQSPHLESGRMKGSKEELPVSGDDKDMGRGRREGGSWGEWAWTYGEHKILLNVCLQVWPYESFESESSGKHVSHRFPGPTPDLLNQTSESEAQGVRLLSCSPSVFCTLTFEC